MPISASGRDEVLSHGMRWLTFQCSINIGPLKHQAQCIQQKKERKHVMSQDSTRRKHEEALPLQAEISPGI